MGQRGFDIAAYTQNDSPEAAPGPVTESDGFEFLVIATVNMTGTVQCIKCKSSTCI